MDNKTNETNETLKKGIIKSFEVWEATRRIVMSEMLMKSGKLLEIIAKGEANTRREEGDNIVKSMEKDQKKVEKLTELIELKEEYIKLFEE